MQQELSFFIWTGMKYHGNVHQNLWSSKWCLVIQKILHKDIYKKNHVILFAENLTLPHQTCVNPFFFGKREGLIIAYAKMHDFFFA